MIIESCELCPRRCGKMRNNENGFGYCKMPALPVVARAGLHFYEEPCISGVNGSGAVFFSGCTLGCVFCQNYSISAERFGKSITIERLAKIFMELEKSGAHNINLVNPTHYIDTIIAALGLYRPKIPVVYNTGGYERVESLKKLDGYIDIYLPDLKYISCDRSAKYSSATDYFKFAAPALSEMKRQVGSEIIENGIMKRGMIVRHLILPQGTAEAISVAQYVHDNLPEARFSLMSQYVPCGRAEQFKEINRGITAREYEKVLFSVEQMNFKNIVYTQELDSGSEKFIPAFDLSGV